MKRWIKITLIVLGALFIIIQFIPVPRTNPPVKSEIVTPPDVKAVLKKGCYDCHSNETVWPWYVHVAPVSWLLWSDVNGARDQMNFTDWSQYDANEQRKAIRNVWKQVSRGDMPPWYYRMMHPPSRLTDADKQVLRRWSGQ